MVASLVVGRSIAEPRPTGGDRAHSERLTLCLTTKGENTTVEQLQQGFTYVKELFLQDGRQQVPVVRAPSNQNKKQKIKTGKNK